jgi:signal transduction histidine kinase
LEQKVSLKVDTKAIRRMLQNLLDNALKFTPRGGAISLKLQNLEEKIVVEIGDTGPGISTEEQKLLFQRFSQGKTGRKYTPGTGLGLYLCKQIVDAHQGEIICISVEGSGTTFRVCLPYAS